MAILWFVVTVIEDWHELHTPGRAKVKLIELITGAIFMGVWFGLLFRAMYDPVARHISIRSEDKHKSENST